jgi:hypothetical protein
MHQIKYIDGLIATLEEALDAHEDGDCKYLDGNDCSCIPYRNDLVLKRMRRQELEEANEEQVDNDIKQALEEAYGL